MIISRHVDSPSALLPAFYPEAVDPYRLLIAATVGHELFSFEERLASVYCILPDTLDKHRAFVQRTFDQGVCCTLHFHPEVWAAFCLLGVSRNQINSPQGSGPYTEAPAGRDLCDHSTLE